MTCVHIRELYQLCLAHNMHISSSELIHIVCHECGVKEECPSTMVFSDDGPSERRTTGPQATLSTGPTTAPNGP